MKITCRKDGLATKLILHAMVFAMTILLHEDSHL